MYKWKKNVYIGAELTIVRCRFDQVPFNLGPKWLEFKQVTMNNILHVKLNCNKQCYEHVSDTVVAKFFRVNDRKIELYLGWFVE